MTANSILSITVNTVLNKNIYTGNLVCAYVSVWMTGDWDEGCSGSDSFYKKENKDTVKLEIF